MTFTLGIYPLGIVWPSGWAWGHGHSHYLMMIVGVYATLGVFLILASRNPDAPQEHYLVPSAWHRWKEIAPTAMPAAQACGAATSHQAESGIGDRYAAVPTHPDGTIKD
jgi:hypothetical protein